MECVDAFGAPLNVGDKVYCVETWDNSVSIKIISSIKYESRDNKFWFHIILKHETYRLGKQQYNGHNTPSYTDSNFEGCVKRLIKK